MMSRRFGITGLEYRDETKQLLLEACRNNIHADTPLESPVARMVPINDKVVLYFSVEKSTRYIHLTSDGRCLQRRDKQNMTVTAEKLQFERQEQISREYDRHFTDGARVTDLDIEMVKRVSEYISKGMSPEKFLQQLGLADYGLGTLQLRRASLLLFAQDVSRWHPRCSVRIVRVRGTELRTGRDYNVISDELSTSNIISLLTSAWEKLRPHLVETKLAPDALFKERVMYPEDACREALINAIAHRDYSNEGSSIEIFIFDDRMEVRSPGGLLSTVRIDELRRLQGLHQSRNALIARVLREIGYMREVGEGMRRIFGLMKEHDLVPPELYSEPSRFSIILRHKSVFSDVDQRWLDGFKAVKLTREEMLVALLGRNGDLISPQQIWETLGLVDTEHYRSIVEQMQVKGVLYNTMPRNKMSRGGTSRRNVKRLVIRSPEQIDKSLSGLFSALSQIEPFLSLNERAIRSLLDQIPDGNIYRSNIVQLSQLLKVLALIDDNKEPTELLHGIWKVRRQTHIQAVESIRNTSSPQKTVTSSARDIYVGNLDYETTKGEIAELFGRVGQVVSIGLPVDFHAQRNRGFAFVKMSSDDEARRAIEELDGIEIRGRRLRLNWSLK